MNIIGISKQIGKRLSKRQLIIINSIVLWTSTPKTIVIGEQQHLNSGRAKEAEQYFKAEALWHNWEPNLSNGGIRERIELESPIVLVWKRPAVCWSESKEVTILLIIYVFLYVLL